MVFELLKYTRPLNPHLYCLAVEREALRFTICLRQLEATGLRDHGAGLNTTPY